jgi:peroxiredoxin
LAVIAVLWTGRGDYAPADVGGIAPDYAALDLDGQSVDLESLRGRAVLLNIWATWCRPCVKEMPALQRLHERYSDQGLVVVAVSVDNPALIMGDASDAVRRFADEYGLTFTLLLDPASSIDSSYPVAGLPMTYLIARDGRIHARIIGERQWDEPAMDAEIRQLLGS